MKQTDMTQSPMTINDDSLFAFVKLNGLLPLLQQNQTQAFADDNLIVTVDLQAFALYIQQNTPTERLALNQYSSFANLAAVKYQFFEQQAETLLDAQTPVLAQALRLDLHTATAQQLSMQATLSGVHQLKSVLEQLPEFTGQQSIDLALNIDENFLAQFSAPIMLADTRQFEMPIELKLNAEEQGANDNLYVCVEFLGLKSVFAQHFPEAVCRFAEAQAPKVKQKAADDETHFDSIDTILGFNSPKVKKENPVDIVTENSHEAQQDSHDIFAVEEDEVDTSFTMAATSNTYFIGKIVEISGEMFSNTNPQQALTVGDALYLDNYLITHEQRAEITFANEQGFYHLACERQQSQQLTKTVVQQAKINEQQVGDDSLFAFINIKGLHALINQRSKNDKNSSDVLSDKVDQIVSFVHLSGLDDYINQGAATQEITPQAREQFLAQQKAFANAHQDVLQKTQASAITLHVQSLAERYTDSPNTASQLPDDLNLAVDISGLQDLIVQHDIDQSLNITSSSAVYSMPENFVQAYDDAIVLADTQNLSVDIVSNWQGEATQEKQAKYSSERLGDIYDAVKEDNVYILAEFVGLKSKLKQKYPNVSFNFGHKQWMKTLAAAGATAGVLSGANHTAEQYFSTEADDLSTAADADFSDMNADVDLSFFDDTPASLAQESVTPTPNVEPSPISTQDDSAAYDSLNELLNGGKPNSTTKFDSGESFLNLDNNNGLDASQQNLDGHLNASSEPNQSIIDTTSHLDDNTSAQNSLNDVLNSNQPTPNVESTQAAIPDPDTTSTTLSDLLGTTADKASGLTKNEGDILTALGFGATATAATVEASKESDSSSAYNSLEDILSSATESEIPEENIELDAVQEETAAETTVVATEFSTDIFSDAENIYRDDEEEKETFSELPPEGPSGFAMAAGSVAVSGAAAVGVTAAAEANVFTLGAYESELTDIDLTSSEGAVFDQDALDIATDVPEMGAGDIQIEPGDSVFDAGIHSTDMPMDAASLDPNISADVFPDMPDVSMDANLNAPSVEMPQASAEVPSMPAGDAEMPAVDMGGELPSTDVELPSAEIFPDEPVDAALNDQMVDDILSVDEDVIPDVADVDDNALGFVGAGVGVLSTAATGYSVASTAVEAVQETDMFADAGDELIETSAKMTPDDIYADADVTALNEEFSITEVKESDLFVTDNNASIVETSEATDLFAEDTPIIDTENVSTAENASLTKSVVDDSVATEEMSPLDSYSESAASENIETENDVAAKTAVDNNASESFVSTEETTVGNDVNEESAVSDMAAEEQTDVVVEEENPHLNKAKQQVSVAQGNVENLQSLAVENTAALESVTAAVNGEAMAQPVDMAALSDELGAALEQARTLTTNFPESLRTITTPMTDVAALVHSSLNVTGAEQVTSVASILPKAMAIIVPLNALEAVSNMLASNKPISDAASLLGEAQKQQAKSLSDLPDDPETKRKSDQAGKAADDLNNSMPSTDDSNNLSSDNADSSELGEASNAEIDGIKEGADVRETNNTVEVAKPPTTSGGSGGSQQVAQTAVIGCTLGMVPMPLNVLPSGIMIEGKAPATILDIMMGVNIPIFGACNIPALPSPTTPCVPTVVPWLPGQLTKLYKGKSALGNKDKCMCARGGIISLKGYNGQIGVSLT